MSQNIITINSAKEVQRIINQLNKKITIFCDIDDTLIVPVSKSFRSIHHMDKHLIDEFKEEYRNHKDYELVLGNWRLQRKAMLVDKEWPNVINHLKSRYVMYGITKMNGGKCGNIQSVEEWRFDDLAKLGITFSQNPSLEEKVAPNVWNCKPSFYKGIFYTGEVSKSKVLELYFSTNQDLKYVVLIDDRIDHLRDIGLFCLQHSIKFLGIHFRGIDQVKEYLDPEITSFQKDFLIKNARWIEDDEVIAMLCNKALIDK